MLEVAICGKEGVESGRAETGDMSEGMPKMIQIWKTFCCWPRVVSFSALKWLLHTHIRAPKDPRTPWHVITGIPHLAPAMQCALLTPKFSIPIWASTGAEPQRTSQTWLEVASSCLDVALRYAFMVSCQIPPAPVDLIWCLWGGDSLQILTAYCIPNILF